MKSCKHCNTPYSGRGKSYCSKTCQYAARRVGRNSSDNVMRWRRSLKDKAIAYMGGCCAACGYLKCQAALEFHHKDATQKEFAIGNGQKIRSWARIQQELQKCVLLCANCHREVHAGLLSIESIQPLQGVPCEALAT